MSARKTNPMGSFSLCFAMCVCGVGGGGLVGGAGDLPDRRVLSSEKQMQEVSGGYEKT